MSPEFAAAIDPIIIETLRFKQSIEQGGYVTADGYNRILQRIEAAEANISDSAARRLSKLALSAWIDILLIKYTEWDGSDWWNEHCLEFHFFSERTSDNDFFKWATDAAGMSSKDALEVFYLVVLLGYRGLYIDGSSSQRLAALHLPKNVDSWCKTAAGNLQLRQGRPNPPQAILSGGSFAPLRGQATLAQYSMLGTVLAAVAIGLAVVYFGLF